jgi:hypothetical protein
MSLLGGALPFKPHPQAQDIFLNFNVHSNHLGIFTKMQTVALAWNPAVQYYYFSGDADYSGPETTLWIAKQPPFYSL